MATHGVVPHYHIVKEEGPSHAKTFYAEVRVDGEIWGHGEGPSKKTAEQAAARMAWMERATREGGSQRGRQKVGDAG